jgi:ABC-type transporter Mla MlaB component
MAEPTDSKRPPLRLPHDCSIAAIRGVYDLIREAFSRHDSLEIDCSSVGKADVTSIQLLLSTTKTGRAHGRQVVLTAFSQSLRNTLRRAGFSNEAMAGEPFNEKK